MSFNYIPPPGVSAPAVQFNKVTHGVKTNTVHMLNLLERVPEAKQIVSAFPAAPQVSFVKSVKRKNNAEIDLDNVKDDYILRHNLPPPLNLRRQEKRCIFKNINVEHRSVNSKCLNVPKLSQRGWTYTTNADESAGRIPPRIEYLHSYPPQRGLNPWNNKRTSQANQLRMCHARDNVFYDANVDSLKHLVPEDAKYIFCESVKNSQLSDEFFRRMASDRLQLSRYALYERYLQTELDDTRDFHKPDVNFLHGVYNFKNKRNLYAKNAQLGNTRVSKPYAAAKIPFTVGELHASLHPHTSSAPPVEGALSDCTISFASDSEAPSSIHLSVSVIDMLEIPTAASEKIVVEVEVDEFLKTFIVTDEERILLADVHAFRRHLGLTRSDDDTEPYKGVTIEFSTKYPKVDQADEPLPNDASDKSSWASSRTVSEEEKSINLDEPSTQSTASIPAPDITESETEIAGSEKEIAESETEMAESETSSFGVNFEDFTSDVADTEATRVTSGTLEERQSLSRQDISCMQLDTSLRNEVCPVVGRISPDIDTDEEEEEDLEVLISSHIVLDTELREENMIVTEIQIEEGDIAAVQVEESDIGTDESTILTTVETEPSTLVARVSNVFQSVTEERIFDDNVATSSVRVGAEETIDVNSFAGAAGVEEVEAKESDGNPQVDMSVVKTTEPEETVPQEDGHLSNVTEEATGDPMADQIKSLSTEVATEHNTVEEVPPNTIEPHTEAAATE